MKKLLVPIILMLIVSCSSDKKGTEVIDKIKLGITKAKYNKLCDSLKIPFDKFYSHEAKKLMLRYTEIFNLKEFNPSNNPHIGVYLPETNSSNTHVTGLNVILGHTSATGLFIDEHKKITIRKPEQKFEQDIRVDLIQKIEEMLIERYGEAKKYNSYETNIYVLKGSLINRVVLGRNNPVEVMKWETNYYDVYLNKGIPSHVTTTDLKHGYLYSSGKIDQSQEEIITNRFAYLYYKLNEKGMKQLDIKKINL